MGLDAILLEARVDSHFDSGVRQGLVQCDAQCLALGTRNCPTFVVKRKPVGGIHPVEWLVSTSVGMDRHAAIGLDHDQPHSLGKMGGEPAVVVDGAAGNDESHCANPNRENRQHQGTIPGPI